MDLAQQRTLLDAMGIDVWLQRHPSAPAPATITAAIAPTMAVEPATVPLEPAVAVIVEPARALDIPLLDWETLRTRVAQCTSCALHRTRTQTVFGVGDPHAEWMVIGEAPGADEDREGEPFVGRAGQLLNAMLLAVGFAREQVYIANILKCRPPGNRDPEPTEAAACRGYLERQIALVQPRLILCVGRIASQNLLRTDAAISTLRGRVFHLEDSGIPVVPTYHPAYLLRAPQEKRKAWEDLKFARRLWLENRTADIPS